MGPPVRLTGLNNLCPDCERRCWRATTWSGRPPPWCRLRCHSAPPTCGATPKCCQCASRPFARPWAEGYTPLLPLPRLGAALGLSQLYARMKPPIRPTPSRPAVWAWRSTALRSLARGPLRFQPPATRAAPWLRRPRCTDSPRRVFAPRDIPRPSSPRCTPWAQKITLVDGPHHRLRRARAGRARWKAAGSTCRP